MSPISLSFSLKKIPKGLLALQLSFFILVQDVFFDVILYKKLLGATCSKN
ncbi:hypothetical protein FORC087_0899 [Bacillus cereus]|nr:hypothetical protein FORC087_0899 [Bacillus cereus]